MVSYWKCLFVGRNMNWRHGVITEKGLSVMFLGHEFNFTDILTD